MGSIEHRGDTPRRETGGTTAADLVPGWPQNIHKTLWSAWWWETGIPKAPAASPPLVSVSESGFSETTCEPVFKGWWSVRTNAEIHSIKSYSPPSKLAHFWKTLVPMFQSLQKWARAGQWEVLAWCERPGHSRSSIPLCLEAPQTSATWPSCFPIAITQTRTHMSLRNWKADSQSCTGGAACGAKQINSVSKLLPWPLRVTRPQIQSQSQHTEDVRISSCVGQQSSWTSWESPKPVPADNVH